jgi:hypothetical protein
VWLALIMQCFQGRVIVASGAVPLHRSGFFELWYAACLRSLVDALFALQQNRRPCCGTSLCSLRDMASGPPSDILALAAEESISIEESILNLVGDLFCVFVVSMWALLDFLVSVLVL